MGVELPVAARDVAYLVPAQLFGITSAIKVKSIIEVPLSTQCYVTVIGQTLEPFGDGFKAGAHAREARSHVAKIVTGDADQFDVIEGGTSRGANSAAKQADFAEIVTALKISEHHFSARIGLRNLHEPNAHELEDVCGLALLDDGLAWSEP